MDELAGGNAGNAGNTGTSTGASDQTSISTFNPNGVGVLPLAFGLHHVAGILAYDRFFQSELIKPSHRFGVLNGEGLGIGWDGPEGIWWGGSPLTASPDGLTPGYHWYPGIYPSGPDDPVQGQDSFFGLRNTLQYSGTCWTAVLLPEKWSTEARPDKLRQTLRCMKVPDFDTNGGQLNVGTANEFTYSPNPARVAAFGLWWNGLLHRNDWPSWYQFKLWCDKILSWDTGTETVDIKRAEAHPVWQKQVSLNELFDTIGLITGVTWQDDGDKIRWILPDEQKPLHHFTVKNIAPGTYKPQPVNLRKRMNRLIVRYRDIRNPYLKQASVTVERENLITDFGAITSEIAIPNMTASQAWRVGEMLMRVVTDYPNKTAFEAYGDSFHLLEGDYALVTNPINGWNNQLVRVNTVEDLNTTSRPDVRRFEVQRIDGPLYRDADQRPVQQELADEEEEEA